MIRFKLYLDPLSSHHLKKILKPLSELEMFAVLVIVRGDRDSRANLMPIYGDLYQIKLEGITNENHLVTHLAFTSGRHYDVIKIAYIAI